MYNSIRGTFFSARCLEAGLTLLFWILQGNDSMATIENVFAIIEGAEEPDR
jgi:hypothetical protein